jgi:hypothetical protein
VGASAVEAVGLGHQRAGADQQVAEAGARGDAGVAVVGGVGIGERRAVAPFAGEEDRSQGTKTRSNRQTAVLWP